MNDRIKIDFLVIDVGDRDDALKDGTDLYEIDGYTTADIGATFYLPKGELSVQMTNAFDRLYLPPSSQTYANNALFNARVTPAPGRAVSLAYAITF